MKSIEGRQKEKSDWNENNSTIKKKLKKKIWEKFEDGEHERPADKNSNKAIEGQLALINCSTCVAPPVHAQRGIEKQESEHSRDWSIKKN